MKVTYFLRDNGACGLYRISQPLKMVKKHTDIKFTEISKGDDARFIQKAIEECDVIILPRPTSPELVSLIETCQSQGKKVIVEVDDNLLDVSPYSPHYGDYGLKNVDIILNNEPMELWRDGKNINLKNNKERIDSFLQCLNIADGLWVTTQILGDHYRPYVKDSCLISYLPNCVNLYHWNKLPIKNERLRLYWSGGHSHYEDFLLLKDVLPVVMEKHDVELHIMGQVFRGIVSSLPKDRVFSYPWIETPAYPYKTAVINPDISIIPLVDDRFNRCKSAIKLIEQGALSVPSVVSNVSPYKELYDGTNMALVDNEPDAWIDAISTLVEDSLLRMGMGLNMRSVIEREYDAEKQYILWEQALRIIGG